MHIGFNGPHEFQTRHVLARVEFGWNYIVACWGTAVGSTLDGDGDPLCEFVLGARPCLICWRLTTGVVNCL